MKIIPIPIKQSTLKRPEGRAPGARRQRAFSLLEVMIAIAILCIGTFAILGLVSSSLENARRLQRPMVDASAITSQLALTNKLVEGEYSGNLGDLLGKTYKDYSYLGEIREIQSNRLFQADYVIMNANGGKDIISRTTTFFYRPDSPPGLLDGGNFGGP
jgi:prepilin-type N-terminal cleavage/methylation domain-containing protein